MVLRLEPRGRLARRGAHLAGHRHFEDLHLLRRADLVVAQVARDEERIALFHPKRAAILELEIDPALEDLDELAVALVIMPAGRPAQALARGHHLGAHPAGARFGDAEVAISEEIAPSLDQDRLGTAGMGDFLPGRCLDRPCGCFG